METRTVSLTISPTCGSGPSSRPAHRPLDGRSRCQLMSGRPPRCETAAVVSSLTARPVCSTWWLVRHCLRRHWYCPQARSDRTGVIMSLNLKPRSCCANCSILLRCRGNERGGILWLWGRLHRRAVLRTGTDRY